MIFGSNSGQFRERASPVWCLPLSDRFQALQEVDRPRLVPARHQRGVEVYLYRMTDARATLHRLNYADRSEFFSCTAAAVENRSGDGRSTLKRSNQGFS